MEPYGAVWSHMGLRNEHNNDIRSITSPSKTSSRLLRYVLGRLLCVKEQVTQMLFMNQETSKTKRLADRSEIANVRDMFVS